MRDLEFRVWSGYGFRQVKTNRDLCFFSWRGNEGPETKITEFKWEQYTGRKDKNGVKIFQGDKYRYADQAPVHIVGDLVRFGKDLRRLGDYNRIKYPYHQEIEIIGNIHEEETK